MEKILISTLNPDDGTSGFVEFHVFVGRVISKLHNIAHFLVDIGRYDEAIACFETLAQNDDSFENGDYAYGIGRAWEGKGDLWRALQWYRIAYENNPPYPEFSEGGERVSAHLRASGEEPDDGYVLGDYAFGRGEVHEKAGNTKRAQQWYRIAHNHSPSEARFAAALTRLTTAP